MWIPHLAARLGSPGFSVLLTLMLPDAPADVSVPLVGTGVVFYAYVETHRSPELTRSPTPSLFAPEPVPFLAVPAREVGLF